MEDLSFAHDWHVLVRPSGPSALQCAVGWSSLLLGHLGFFSTVLCSRLEFYTFVDKKLGSWAQAVTTAAACHPASLQVRVMSRPTWSVPVIAVRLGRICCHKCQRQEFSYVQHTLYPSDAPSEVVVAWPLKLGVWCISSWRTQTLFRNRNYWNTLLETNAFPDFVLTDSFALLICSTLHLCFNDEDHSRTMEGIAGLWSKPFKC